METFVFTDPAVSETLQKFVPVQLYTDGQGEQYRANQKLLEERLGHTALPSYLILDPQGNELARQVGGSDAKEFLAFLNRGLEGFQN